MLLLGILALPLGLGLTFLASSTLRWLSIVGVLAALLGLAIIALLGRGDRRSLLVVPLVIVVLGGSGFWLSHRRTSLLRDESAVVKGYIGGLRLGNDSTRASEGYTFYSYTVSGVTYMQPIEGGGHRVGDTVVVRYARSEPGISELAR
jgi:hypothetical protein